MDEKDFIVQTVFGACRSIMRYNTNTSEFHVIKTVDGEWIREDAPINALQFTTEFLLTHHIHNEDVILFKELFDYSMIDLLCERRQNGSLIVYRRIEGDRLVWNRLSMYVPEDYSREDKPYILLTTRDMSSLEATRQEAWELLLGQIYKIMKVNVKDNTFTVLKEQYTERQLRKDPTSIRYDIELQHMKENYVHPHDAQAFIKYMDPEYIRQYFAQGNREYQFFFRRRYKGTYRWVRLNIIPTFEYEHGIEEFYFYESDVNKIILKLLDIQAATNYVKFFSDRNERFSEGYYENLLQVVSSFTQPFVDFYMLDLDKDICINYKISDNFFNEHVPFIANYTQITREYLDTNYSGETREYLEAYSSSEKIRELLKDKMTLQYTFPYPNGVRVTTTITKSESRNGVPTKVICSTLPAVVDDVLQIKTFGNFEAIGREGKPISFSRKQSKQLLAYLIDRNGFPVTSKDIVVDILEKDPSDMKAIKYVSTLVRRAISDLEAAGYPNVIIKEHKSVRVNTDAVDCDYYHLLNGEIAYWGYYHNEYMKEYSWAEETNAEILHMAEE